MVKASSLCTTTIKLSIDFNRYKNKLCAYFKTGIVSRIRYRVFGCPLYLLIRILWTKRLYRFAGFIVKLRIFELNYERIISVREVNAFADT